MKRFKTFLKELDLSREPSAMDDIIDLTKQKPNVKPGTKWTSSLQKRNGPTVTKKQADAINKGKDTGGSPFPDSWSKPDVADNKTSLPTNKPKFTISNKQRPTTNKTSLPPRPTVVSKQTPTTNKTSLPTPTQTPTTNKVDRMRPNVNDRSTWPKGIDINKTSFATHADDDAQQYQKPAQKPSYMTPVRPKDASTEKSLKADTRSNADLDKLFK